MITNSDINKLKGTFVTKEDLKHELDSRFQVVALRFNSIESAFGNLETKFERLEHMVNDRFDRLLKELINLRLEFSGNRQEHDDITGRLDNIESLPTIAHELSLRKTGGGY